MKSTREKSCEEGRRTVSRVEYQLPGTESGLRNHLCDLHCPNRTETIVNMYQSLALSSNQSPYSHDTGNYIHPSASSPVYVPTTRVPAMLPTLPTLSYLQPCESPHQAHGLGGHHGWPQTATDSSSFTASSSHPPHGFSYSHSPPASSNTGRDTTYQSPLVLGNSSRADQYGGGLVRSVGGSYSSPYAYMSPEMATSSWTPGPLESGVMSLQGRHGGLSRKRSALGKQDTNPSASIQVNTLI